MKRALAAAALAALTVVAALPTRTDAQKDAKEPRRPRLAEGADTNDAHTYFEYGVSKLDRDPDDAANAFYWAARINPLYADAYYGRRVALLMHDKRRLERYWFGDKRTAQSDEVRRIDSLYYHALTLDPFLYKRLDRYMFDAVLDQWSEEIARQYNVSGNEVRYYIERDLQNADPEFLAWRAYTEGDFQHSLDLYAKAIKQSNRKAWLRVERGRLFFQLDRADSGLAELTAAVDEMRKEDKKDLVFVYESKALLEQSVGMIQYRMGNVAAAKESYGRALQEDLSYSPAHIQLAYLALEAKDTTTALNEMETAVQLRGDDPGTRYLYGFTLASVQKLKEAEEQLRKAVELDPMFALPYHALGEVLEAEGHPADALVAYNGYVAHASLNDTRRDETANRVKTLGAMQQGTPKP